MNGTPPSKSSLWAKGATRAAFQENVNLTVITDSEKLFIFYKKLQENTPDGIQAILYTSKAMEKTYRQLVDMLIRADPPVIKAHKVNALTEEKQPCHGFAKGHCKFGDKCRFSHKEVTPPPGSKGSKGSKKKGENDFDFQRFNIDMGDAHGNKVYKFKAANKKEGEKWLNTLREWREYGLLGGL